MIRTLLVFGIMLLLMSAGYTQNIFYKNPSPEMVALVGDSARRVIVQTIKKDTVLLHQFNYVLQFYPDMRVKNIIVDFKKSRYVVRTRPYFFSIFKAPSEQVYHVTFSNSTKSTLDSVLIGNLF